MELEILIAHREHRERRPLRALDSITIGRDADCTISLDSPLISRRHVTLAISGPMMRVQDSSRNGTLAGALFLNNSAEEVPLGTPLTVGEYTLSVLTSALSAPADEAPEPKPEPPPPAQATPEPAAGLEPNSD